MNNGFTANDKDTNNENTNEITPQEKDAMKKKALYFVILTFFASYLLATAYYLAGGRLGNLTFVIMGTCYMFIPMSMAIILQKFVYKGSLKDLGISFKLNWWWLVAWIMPVVLAFLTILMSLIIPGIHYSSGMEGFVNRFGGYASPLTLLISGMIAGITVNAVAAFGEEFGWRGFLLKQYSFLGFWKMSLAIGIIWGLWHAPLILMGYNYPQNPVLGVFMMTIFTTLFTPLIVYVRIRSKSVIAAAIMHGTLNGTAGISFLFVSGGTDLTMGIMGLAGFMAMIIMNLIVVLYDRKISREPIMV